MQRIFLLDFSLFLFPSIGFYCYHGDVWTAGTSYKYFIAKDMANLSNDIMVIQYINIMQILRHRFRNLNQRLAKCCDSKSRLSDHSLIQFGSCKNLLHIRTTQTASAENNLTDIPTTQNYILPDISVPMSNREPDEVSRIHTLRQIYSDLYDITETINGMYGYQITLELAYVFFFRSFIILHNTGCSVEYKEGRRR
jgi:hypothetical protein